MVVLSDRSSRLVPVGFARISLYLSSSLPFLTLSFPLPLVENRVDTVPHPSSSPPGPSPPSTGYRGGHVTPAPPSPPPPTTFSPTVVRGASSIPLELFSVSVFSRRGGGCRERTLAPGPGVAPSVETPVCSVECLGSREGSVVSVSVSHRHAGEREG